VAASASLCCRLCLWHSAASCTLKSGHQCSSARSSAGAAAANCSTSAAKLPMSSGDARKASRTRFRAAVCACCGAEGRRSMATTGQAAHVCMT
jgi:hypothetical protein